MNIKSLFTFAIIFLLPILCWATHNRAGEISFRQIGPLTLEVTVTTYTKASSQAADRDSVEINWGDGFIQTIARVNGNGQILNNDVKKNLYRNTHTYPAIGSYTLSMMDPNRIEMIRNVNYPHSVIVPFYIETRFTFTNTQFQGFNSSPQLLQPPIDIGCVGQTFRHNPNAFDIDGDSLAYELIVPLQSKGVEVSIYQRPDEINPVGNRMSLDPVTGDLVWITPRERGDYNIAILIKEYRNGQLINSIIRDMQIFIDNCNNVPPIIETPDDLCVIAGETITFEVSAVAPEFETSQKVRITALGGPFAVEGNRATFTVDPGYQDDPLVGIFRWVPECNQISQNPYNLVFRTVDDFFGSTGLADLKSLQIKVMGPPPNNPTIDFINNKVRIEWDEPYACDMTDDDYFSGFSIWRRQGSNPFIPDSCTAGLTGQGYSRIAFNKKDIEDGNYFYIDDDALERGNIYCYRLLGEFALRTPSGLPYNPVKSIPSIEICIQLGRDLPFLTKVDVTETDINLGEIELNWSKPLAEDLDTIQNSGPYIYQVLVNQDNDFNSFIEIPGAQFTYATFGENHLNQYTHKNLDTEGLQYNYRLEFFTNNNTEALGKSPPSSSIFLTVYPTDERNELNWTVSPSWLNFSYEIYRLNNTTGTYDIISTLSDSSYVDANLINGEDYCYFIRSYGSYGIIGFNDTLVNNSQTQCATPIDNIPPCSPPIVITNACIDDDWNLELFLNQLTWEDNSTECEDSDDITNYRLYFSSTTNGEYDLLDELDNSTFLFDHFKEDQDLSGCYYITAVDSVGNEGIALDTICSDNCPSYTLPNTFTPDNNGLNDLFIPLENIFVAKIEIKIFNRWGNQVFETEDPEINWDGTDLKSGKELPDGTYFYVCRVFENKLGGPVERAEKLTGFIDLFR